MHCVPLTVPNLLLLLRWLCLWLCLRVPPLHEIALTLGSLLLLLQAWWSCLRVPS
jgi:hypothetical protein